MGFQDKIMQQRRERSTEDIIPANENFEESVNAKFFGIENNRSYPSCLDLRLTEGKSKAIPYSFITEIDFDASEGIEILTTTKRIGIIGRNLHLLYKFLTAYRVKYIQSNTGNDLCNDDDLFVKMILIEEL